jgi:hypothetical protein
MDNEEPRRGRPFPKGNPGRKRGSKNKTTLLATSLAGEQGEEILHKAIEMAKGGNVPMMKFLLDRILPKERPIQLDLPRLDYPHDSVDAIAEIVDAVSSGRISPREAADIAQLVSAFTRAIDVTEAQTEIDSLKSKLDGLSADFNIDSSGANSRKS